MEEKKKLVLDLTIGIILFVLGLGAAITGYVLNFDFKAAWFIYALYICGTVLMFLGICFAYLFLQERKEKVKKLNVRQMTLIAMQSAITIILYYYAKFNLPFFPGWLDIQVSEIPAIITSFIYGPAAGCLVIFIRFITKLPGTITAGVGELADLILGLTLVIISGNIYKKHKTLKGAIVGTAIGVGAATIMACFTNWLILIPAYVNIAGFPMAALVSMLDKIYPSFTVTEANFMASYIFIGVVPFNLFRYAIVVIITFILYKKTHFIFDKFARVNNDSSKAKDSQVESVPVDKKETEEIK